MEWIKLEDKKPEHNQQCFTYFGDMAFGIWDNDEQAFYEGSMFTDSKFTVNVTHWMPLPLAPSQKE